MDTPTLNSCPGGEAPNSNDELGYDAAEDKAASDEVMRYVILDMLKTREGIEKFVANLSDQMLLKKTTSWGEMLGAAPSALCSVGQCFLAASSHGDLSLVQLPESKGLESRSLRVNLSECSHLGRLAFEDAHKSMNRVSIISRSICRPNGIVDTILTDLKDENLVKIDLDCQLANLKTASNECVDMAQNVNRNFIRWCEFARDLCAACEVAEGGAGWEKRRLTGELYYVGKREEQQTKIIEKNETEMGRLIEDRDQEQRVYKAATDSLPTGFAAIGYDALASVLETVKDVADNFQTVGLASRFLRYWKRSSAVAKQEPLSPAVKDPDEDFGLRLCEKMSKDLFQLNECLYRGQTGPPEYGADLNTLIGFANSRSHHGHPPLIEILMRNFTAHQSESVYEANQQSGSETTEEAIRIIDEVLKLVDDINARFDEWQGLSTEPEQGKIQQWQATIKDAFEANEKLRTQREKLIRHRDDHFQKRSESSKASLKKPSKKWAQLKYLRENASISQKRLEESQKLIAEQTERQRESSRKFNELQLELLKLNDEDVTISRVIKILNKCIRNLGEFQNHVSELVIFFDQLSAFVEEIHRQHTLGFVGSTEGILQIDADVTITEESRKKTKETLQERLLLDALQLQGHYAVAGEIAGMYVDVSKKYILPGVKLVSQLGLPDDIDADDFEDLNSKTKRLTIYARKAQSEINKVSEQRRTELREKLFDQQREIQDLENTLIEDKPQPEELDDEWDNPE